MIVVERMRLPNLIVGLHPRSTANTGSYAISVLNAGCVSRTQRLCCYVSIAPLVSGQKFGGRKMSVYLMWCTQR
jgi:hypothetical protein